MREKGEAWVLAYLHHELNLSSLDKLGLNIEVDDQCAVLRCLVLKVSAIDRVLGEIAK